MKTLVHSWNLSINHWLRFNRIHLGEAFLFLKVKKFRISLAESRKVTTFVATPIAHEGLEGQILLEKGR